MKLREAFGKFVSILVMKLARNPHGKVSDKAEDAAKEVGVIIVGDIVEKHEHELRK